MADWQALERRERRRYEDARTRLAAEGDVRQGQLVRAANAALGAGLASLMAGDGAPARTWFLRAAELYRESYAHAPAESWGRMIGAIKMRLLAGDDAGAASDARWTLGEAAATSASPIGRYAAALALLVLGDDMQAELLARGLREECEANFPREVADAVTGLAGGDADRYADGLARTLRSFETREAFLEDVPVADTVLVLERLAARRGFAQDPVSALLPP